MNHNDFDDILKKKLGEIPIENSMPDWDRMNKELEEDSMKDQMFDEQVNRKLQQLNGHNFAKPSWNSLYELIDKRIQNKRRIIAAKAFEMMVVFLLFFTAFNTGIVNNQSQNTNNPAVSANQMIAETQMDQNSFDQNQVSQLDVVNTIESTTPSNNSASNRAFASNETSNSPSESIPTQIDQNLNNTSNTVPVTSQIASLNSSSLQQVTSIASNTSELHVNHVAEIPTEILEKAFPKNFASLTIPVLETELLDQSFAYNNLPSLTATSTKPSNWFVGASVSLQNHEIESASFKSIQSQGQRNVPALLHDEFKQSLGTSAGIQVGRRFGNAELVTGVELQRIKYSPDLILTTGTLSSFTETHFEEIQYDFLSIPLEVNVAVMGRSSWKARLHAGVVTSFLLDAKERISQTLIRGNRITEIESGLVDRSVFEYNFEEGLLANDIPQEQKTSFLQSLRYKANIGLSVSKQLNKRTELFGRTDFFYQIPTSSNLLNEIDLINTVSFSFGVKQFLG